jgi:probable phosphoglycerate mutase
METASILAEPHKGNVHAVPAFREIDHGIWEGLTREEAELRFSTMYARWEADPFHYSPEGGESGLSLMARAMPALLSLVEKHAGQTICLVSHKATIRLLLSGVIGFDPRTYRDRLDLCPASLSILDFRDSCHGRLTLFNDVAHYATGGGSIPPPPEGRLSKVWGKRGAGKR